MLILPRLQLQLRDPRLAELRYRIGRTADSQVRDENARIDRRTIVRGNQPRKALFGRKPERARAVADCRREFSMRQAIGARKVPDVAGLWVQAIHALGCAGVDASLTVFHDAVNRSQERP